MNIKNLTLATLTLTMMLGCAAVPSSNSKTPQEANLSTATEKEVKSSPTLAQKTSTATNSKANTKSRFGSFVNAEHPTSGMASLVQENGISYIEFDQNFKTDSGPDLFVILHRSPDILKISKAPDYGIAEGDYVAIAPLKSINGKQRYEIPQNIQIDNYNSVAVWCRKFNATFGFAPLS